MLDIPGGVPTLVLMNPEPGGPCSPSPSLAGTAEDAQAALRVKLRFFSGMNHDEIAALLGVNEKTVRRHWELAKVWLYRAMEKKT